MDAILAQVLELACLLRNSEEARIWRNSWGALLKTKPGTPNSAEMLLDNVPIIELIGQIRLSDAAQCRPLLFPLVVSKFAPHLRGKDFQSGLENHPKILNAYRELLNCFRFTSLLISSLRSIGPGYPHPNLVYTLPSSPWLELTNRNELPWQLGEVVRGTRTQSAKSLDRFMPSISQPLAIAIDTLLQTIIDSDTWRQMEKSYRVIQSHKNLIDELGRARTQFEKGLGTLRQSNFPQSLWQDKVEELVSEIYSKRGPRIKAYVDSFLAFEQLIERIYWLVSHIVIFESISTLTTADSRQLQQVSLGCGQNALITALAPTFAETLAIGQLVHLSLVESDHHLDGLYQVENLVQRYEVSSGAHILFRARCLWYCQLADVLQLTCSFGPSVFVPSETMNILEGIMLNITDPDGDVVASLRPDELISFELSRTMYLP